MEVQNSQIEIIGLEHPDTDITEINIANCLQEKDNYDKELDEYMEEQESQIEILGQKHPNTLVTKLIMLSLYKKTLFIMKHCLFILKC